MHEEGEAETGGDVYGERVCTVLEGDAEATWLMAGGDREWTDGGSYFAVRESGLRSDSGESSDGGWTATPDDATREAVAAVYAFAFDRLDSRGVGYDDWQLRRMIDERVEAFMRGDEIEFPRVEIDDIVVAECARPDGGAETYTATLLAEYPISRLRGDVNNALWYSERVRNEAGVLVSSARSLFAEGRWLDALLELKKSRDLLGTACRQPSVGDPSESVEALMNWAAGSLSVEALGGVRVIDVGERREVDVPFRWSYKWEGLPVMAVRLPVTCRPHGFEAVFDSDSETDETGTAHCRVVVAYGEPGEHAIEPGLDFEVIAGALGEEYASRLEPFAGPLRPVFLVEGAHALSVCLEIDGADEADGTQFRAGFARRMEREGFLLEECGPDVDVVISAHVEMESRVVGDEWKAVVNVRSSAFDQRTALVIGRPSVLSDESLRAGKRESEVLALQEAGRLLAASLTHRILASGD